MDWFSYFLIYLSYRAYTSTLFPDYLSGWNLRHFSRKCSFLLKTRNSWCPFNGLQMISNRLSLLVSSVSLVEVVWERWCSWTCAGSTGTFQGPVLNDDHPSLGRSLRKYDFKPYFLSLTLSQEPHQGTQYTQTCFLKLLNSLYYYLVPHMSYRIAVMNYIV